MAIRFGAFVLDHDRRMLLRDGQEIHISPKAFRLLEILLERQPAAVSKQDLYDGIWPDTFIAESNLPSLVCELRAALDDDTETPRFIRTVHRFGYAFCGEAVEELGREAQDPSPRQPIATLVWGSRIIPLYEGAAVLGRELHADIPIEDRTVSRCHAVIEVSEDRVILRDLESKNGTYVQGSQLKGEIELTDGDAVELGEVRLVYRSAAAALTTTSMARPKYEEG